MIDLNERDYDLFSYMSIAVGFVTIMNWLLFMLLFGQEFTLGIYLIFSFIGVLSLGLSLFSRHKKRTLVKDMQEEINEQV